MADTPRSRSLSITREKEVILDALSNQEASLARVDADLRDVTALLRTFGDEWDSFIDKDKLALAHPDLADKIKRFRKCSFEDLKEEKSDLREEKTKLTDILARLVDAATTNSSTEANQKSSRTNDGIKPYYQYFQYSCRIIKGRTRRKFRANLFRLAQIHRGFTRENVPTDGIVKDGKNINVCLIFTAEGDLCRFQDEILGFISAVSGNKRPLINVAVSAHPHAVILMDEQTEDWMQADKMKLNRVFQHHYQHDTTGDDPDNSAECDGYSDVVTLHSAFGETVNISDPEVCAQMIEDPRTDFWMSSCPEAAHIKDKAKCSPAEKNDPNNFIYMSRQMHCYFDGLNAKPSKFPGVKIRYIRHEEAKVPCPSFGINHATLGLPPRQRVIVHVIFWSAQVSKYAMLSMRDGIPINETTVELDLYFRDAKKAKTFLEWKEKQTEKAWAAMNEGVPVDDFVEQEGIGRREEDLEVVVGEDNED